MYWSYLINTNKNAYRSNFTCNINNDITTNTQNMTNEILTFEFNEDLNKLTNDYCDLVISNFFSSFTHDYDTIFISDLNPTQEPLNNKLFIIKFNDLEKATFILNKKNNL